MPLGKPALQQNSRLNSVQNTLSTVIHKHRQNMRYQGGKARQAKRFTEAILKQTTTRERYLEPFVGGASVAATIAPHFKQLILSDASKDLILMYQAYQQGWRPTLILEKEEYETLRLASPSPERAWAGYAGSYCGKWFGGYGPAAGERNYLAESARSLDKKMLTLQNATFKHQPYMDTEIRPTDVVYCDPPYAETTAYKDFKFDTKLFWENMETWVATGATVFVSEYDAPPNWVTAYSTDRFTVIANKDNAKRNIERLYMHKTQYNSVK